MIRGSTRVVIDTSAILAVVLDEPERPALIAATQGAALLAPASLPWEVGNALVAAVRRRRLTPAEAATAWEAYSAVPLQLVEVDIGEAVSAAIDLGLYAYDAYMVVLARTQRLPLLTLDQRLGAVAASAQVTLLELR